MKIVVATHNEGKLVEIEKILQEQLGQLADGIELVSAGSLGLPDPAETGITFEENALIKAYDASKRTGLPAIADDSGLIVDVLGAAPGILSARWAGAHGHDRANNALLLAQIEDIPDSLRSARFVCCAALVYPPEFAGSSSHGEQDQAVVDGKTRVAADHQVHCSDDTQESGSADDTQNQAMFKSQDMYPSEVEQGQMPGFIIRKPRGENGFGYDPIFVPNDQPTVTSENHSAGQSTIQSEEHQGVAEPILYDEDDPVFGAMATAAQLTAEQKNAISHRGKALRALVKHIANLVQ